jgi:hypothetical protein
MSSATDTLEKQLEADDEQIKSLLVQINYNQTALANCPVRYMDMHRAHEKAHIALNRELNAVKKAQGERRAQLAQYQHAEEMLVRDHELKQARQAQKEDAEVTPQAPPGGIAPTPDPKVRELLESITGRK